MFHCHGFFSSFVSLSLLFVFTFSSLYGLLSRFFFHRVDLFPCKISFPWLCRFKLLFFLLFSLYSSIFLMLAQYPFFMPFISLFLPLLLCSDCILIFTHVYSTSLYLTSFPPPIPLYLFFWYLFSPLIPFVSSLRFLACLSLPHAFLNFFSLLFSFVSQLRFLACLSLPLAAASWFTLGTARRRRHRDH